MPVGPHLCPLRHFGGLEPGWWGVGGGEELPSAPASSGGGAPAGFRGGAGRGVARAAERVNVPAAEGTP